MNEGIDLWRYFFIARRRMWYFVLPFMLLLVVSVFVILRLPKIYDSSAKIIVESQLIPDQFVKSTVDEMATQRIEIIEQRVTTRENLLKLADKFGLFKNRADLTRPEIVDLMRESVHFDPLQVAKPGIKRTIADGFTVAFSLGFEYDNPQMAAKVANELVTFVLDEDIRNRTSRATETTKFLTRESDRLNLEVRELDRKISEYKLANSSTLPEKLAFTMSLVERQQGQITEMDRALAANADQRRLVELDADIRRYVARSAEASGAGTGDGMGLPAGSLEEQLAALQAIYKQKAMLYSDVHPEMRVLRRRISSIQSSILAMQPATSSGAGDTELSLEVRITKQKLEGIDQSAALLVKQREELRASIISLQDIVQKIPEVGSVLQSMEGKRSALQIRAEDITGKLAQARLGERMEEDQQAERFEVIESPIVPTEPIRPKKLRLLLIAFGMALFVAGAVAFGSEFMDHTIRRSEDITQTLNSRLLVAIPYIETRGEVNSRRRKTVLSVMAVLTLLFSILLWLNYTAGPLDEWVLASLKKMGLR